MKKEDEMHAAILNFHRIYYGMENTPEGWGELHHAAEHLFNAAEITSSCSPPGVNDGFISAAQRGEAPPKELEAAWDRIKEDHKKGMH